MANLPPRPESPLRLGSARDDRRHIVDERERDRRAAQPMAPRYRSPRPERLPDRDRTYMPRPKGDTYIADYDGRREDRRDYDDRDRDRDRDRSRRDYDRDRRNWERERERDRSPPPRRWSPDRRYDRERGPPRRPSPTRRSGPRRDSRSPLPRRKFSRSPYRGRNRSRSRSRPFRSPPPRAIRLGNHSIAASPRSRSSHSPRRRRYSRERSPASPDRRPNQRAPSPRRGSPRREEHKPLPTGPLADRHKEEHVAATSDTQNQTTSISMSTVEEISQDSVAPQKTRLEQSEKVSASQSLPEPIYQAMSQPTTKTEAEDIKMESIPEPELPVSQNYPEPKPDVPYEDILPKVTVPPEAPEVKMDFVDSPKPPTLASTQSRGSTPPKPSPNLSDQNRGLPTGPRWGGPRSPPRGPRSHLQPRPPPVQSSSSYRSAPRGPRRDFRGGPPSSYLPATPKTGPSLPPIPKYSKPNDTDALESEIARLQGHRGHLNVEHFQHVSNSRKALQELDMASIELHAAENRRRITELQLEMARTGSLGIDAQLTDVGGI
ncbi:hypothetical protein BDN70DRAFT_873215 [Pholiota conissans]|uniref:Uncharacterized protein n=1 Tax=Pholiota conissans TaxID=109636 RepID=A0A9P6D4T4_9AGAR|nr:hypothetical protein BDN70DRAFT_873215 [Pholiota conissans]